MTIDLSTYNDKLYSSIKFSIVMIFLIIVIVLVALLLMNKNKLLERNTAIILCVCSLVLSASIYFLEILPVQKDINQQSYIVYDGEFYVKETKSANRSGTYIYIQSSNDSSPIRYEILCDINEINNDTIYTGYFVYSKHSKIIVDIRIE